VEKSLAATKANVLKNLSGPEQIGPFPAQGGRRESLLPKRSLNIPWEAIYRAPGTLSSSPFREAVWSG